MIGIIDYGLCNIISVASAIRRLGHEAVITNNPDILAHTDKLILPGVGAFGDAMHNLDELNLIPLLRHRVLDQACPILGICLGFQLLCDTSEEFGSHAGLGFIRARVSRFDGHALNLRVPHMGWNNVHQTRPSAMFENIPDGEVFSFVHSHRVVAPEDEEVCVGTCEYGNTFCAAMLKGNIWGTQFHPEKSQRYGLQLLANFLGKP